MLVFGVEHRWVDLTMADATGLDTLWVLKLDADYQVALVGSPNRKYLWVLSREPALDQTTLELYLAEARRQGFDLTTLIVPQHTGREVTADMLA